MSLNKVPCCFYPTKILIVDDHPEFMKWMTVKFEAYGACEIFHSGSSAYDMLKNYHPQNFVSRMSTKSEFDFLINPEHKKITIELEKIRKERGSSMHQHEISVAVIDYDMPGLNGFELCQKIKHLPIKKVMLTAEADHKLAVEAFNEGIIDRFILKNSPNIVETLSQAVFELQIDYFYELSKAVAENPQENVEVQISCLTDAAFAGYFFDVVKKHHIAEFYLLNHLGDFLMQDRFGKSYELGVRDLQAIEGLHHLAQDLYKQDPDEESKSVLNEVLAEKKVPFFPKDFDEYYSLAEWKPYFHEIEEVKGAKTTYYCSFFPLNG